MLEKDISRFWAKVQKTGGCWLWTARTNKKGYGQFGLAKRVQQAHRVSWLIHHGDIPPGMLVCHHCDNPPCVNPAHLFTGTASDNARDMVEKGRHSVGDRKGEKHPMAKLNTGQVVAIRSDTRSLRVIAKAYGVDKSTIEAIKARSTWSHVI